MEGDSEVFSQIGSTLANHFDCVYYVDVKTGKYHEYVHMDSLDKLGIPQSGEDFFSDFRTNLAKWLDSDDLQLAIQTHEKKNVRLYTQHKQRKEISQ